MSDDMIDELDAKRNRLASLRRQPISTKFKLGVVLLSVPGIWILKQSFLALLLWMLPSIVIFITDRKPGRPLFQAVATMNFGGVFFFLTDLFIKHKNDLNHLQELMQDSLIWLTVYSSAALGYGVFYISPYIAMIAIRMVNKGRLMHIRSVQNRLVRDWGPVVTEYPKQGQS